MEVDNYNIKFINPDSQSNSRQSSSHYQQHQNMTNQQAGDKNILLGSSLTKIPEEEAKIDYNNIYMGMEVIQKSRPATKGISKTDSVKIFNGPLMQSLESDSKESA